MAMLERYALRRPWTSQQGPQNRLHLQEALSEAAPSPSSPPLVQKPPKHERAQEAMKRPHRPPSVPTQPLSGLPGRALLCGQDREPLSPGHCALWDPLSPLEGLPRAGASNAHPEDSSACSSEPTQTPASRPRKHPQKKMIKKTQSFEMPQAHSGPGDSCQPGHTDVFIKGLEVTSTVSAEKEPPLGPHAGSPPATRSRSLSSPSRLHSAEEDGKRQVGR
ncbi:Pleckstrin y domain-containing G member 4B [Saguinus oedipus]|uniref:Pleckstrin y domain-containing G member 4B n=1 Tax=Saguinus oedipus TaxID=9490 RepID=A0ABQ9T983_SAGOE|nr:Pleckstrin y domain-containing G member 4B [Saguinus oedipus]